MNAAYEKRLEDIAKVQARARRLRPSEVEAAGALAHLATINPTAVGEALDLIVLARGRSGMRRTKQPAAQLPPGKRPITPGSRRDRKRTAEGS